MVLLFFLGILIVFCEKDTLNTLILHSNVNVLETHTNFVHILKILGHNVSAFNVNDVKAYKFLHFYSNVIIFAGKESTIDANEITEFMDNGGNVMIISDTYSGPSVRKLISQVGFSQLSQGSYILSPMKTIIDKYTIPIDVADSVLASDGIFHTIPYRIPLFYRGSALRYDRSNNYIINIVGCTEYHTIFNEERKAYNPALVNGFPLSFVGAVEMNNGRRVVVVPSVEFFNDQFMDIVHSHIEGLDQHIRTSNKLIVQQLLEWNFNEIGNLVISDVEHYLVRTGNPLKQYTVMEEIVYKVKIQVKSHHGLVPFLSKNVFFELNRIETHIRVRYNHTDDGIYSVRFHIPDFIGIYKCVTLFDKPGYSVLNHYEQIVVRPRKHDGFQRFVIKFWPYYFTSFLMMALTYFMLYLVINVKVKVD